jgi:hypothetical protein
MPQAGAKLDFVLAARGESGAAGKLDKMADAMSRATGADDDAISEASARMINLGASAQHTADIFPQVAAKARIAGKDMNAAAMLAGKAFQSGNTAGLKKIGIDIGDAGEAAVKAAYKISDAAGQLELLNQLKKTLGNVDISAGVDKGIAARGYYKKVSDDYTEEMGKGAGAMRARWQSAATPLLDAAANSGAAPVIGGALEIATQLAPVTTAFVTLGQAMPALKELPSVGASI